MRYTDIDLETSDIMWFAIDKNGYIGAFTSGGMNIVPEFVCRSKEETELLEDYFLNSLSPSTAYILDVCDADNFLMRDSKSLSEKGLFCFNMSEEAKTDYDLLAHPQIPQNFESLPKNIYNILKFHRISCDFTIAKTVKLL